MFIVTDEKTINLTGGLGYKSSKVYFIPNASENLNNTSRPCFVRSTE